MPFFWYNIANMVKNLAAALRRMLPFGVSAARILPLTVAAIVLFCTAAFAKNSDITPAAKSQIHRQTQFAVHNNWQMAADNRQTQFEFEQTQFAVRNDWQQTAHNRQTQFKQFDFDALPLQNAPQVVPENVVVAQAANISFVGGSLDIASGVIIMNGIFHANTNQGRYISVFLYDNDDTNVLADAVKIGDAGKRGNGGHLAYDTEAGSGPGGIVISNMRFTLSAFLATATHDYTNPHIRFAALKPILGSGGMFTGTLSQKVRIHGITNVGGIVWWGGLQFSGTYAVQLSRLRNVRGLAATAAELSYQWQVKPVASAWANIAGQTGISYAYSMPHFRNPFAYRLRVIATDRAGLRSPMTEQESFVTLAYSAGKIVGTVPGGAYPAIISQSGSFRSGAGLTWRGSGTEGGTFTDISGIAALQLTLPTPSAVDVAQKWVLLHVNGRDDESDPLSSTTIPIQQFGLVNNAGRTPIISKTGSGANILFGWTNRDALMNVRGIKAPDGEISVAWEYTCETGQTCPAFSAAQKKAQTLTIASSDAALYDNVSVGVGDVANTATVFSAAQNVALAPVALLAGAGRTPIISYNSSGANFLGSDFLFSWTNRDALMNVNGVIALDSDISVIWKGTCKASETCTPFTAVQQSAQTLTIAKSQATLYQGISLGVVDVVNDDTVYSAAQVPDIRAFPGVAIVTRPSNSNPDLVINVSVARNRGHISGIRGGFGYFVELGTSAVTADGDFQFVPYKRRGTPNIRAVAALTVENYDVTRAFMRVRMQYRDGNSTDITTYTDAVHVITAVAVGAFLNAAGTEITADINANADSVDTAAAAITYQWQRAQVINGTYTNTGTRTRVINLGNQADDYPYFRVSIDYTGTDGNAGFALSQPVLVRAPSIEQDGLTVRLKSGSRTFPTGANINIITAVLEYRFSEGTPRDPSDSCSPFTGDDFYGCRPAQSLYVDGGDITSVNPVFVFNFDNYVLRPQTPQHILGSGVNIPNDVYGMGMLARGVFGNASTSEPRRYVNLYLEYTAGGVRATIRSAQILLTLPPNIMTITTNGEVLGVSLTTTFADVVNDRKAVLAASTITFEGPHTSYQWLKSSTADGTYTRIVGATLSAFGIPGNEDDRFYRVFIKYPTVLAGPAATNTIIAIMSLSHTVPNRPRLGVSISMNTSTGTTLVFAVATVTTNRNLVNFAVGVAYNWERSANGISYSAISGADSKTYQIQDDYDNAFPYVRAVLSYPPTGGGATRVVYSPPVIVAQPVAPTIIQTGRTVKIDSGGFPIGATDKQSILEYVLATTGIFTADSCGPKSNNICRPALSQYDSGTDAPNGLFVLQNEYFLRYNYNSGGTRYHSSSDITGQYLGFISKPVTDDNGPSRRFVRMRLLYKLSALGDTTQTLRTDFISLTLAADVLQLSAGGTNGRTLALSVVAAYSSLLNVAANSTITWQSSDTAGGTYAAVAGQTNTVYVAPSAVTDNRFYRVIWRYDNSRTLTIESGQARPNNEKITITLSVALADRFAASLAVNVNDADGGRNSTLSLVVTEAEAFGSSVSYQWQNAVDVSGNDPFVWADIANATAEVLIFTPTNNLARPNVRMRVEYLHSQEDLTLTIYSPDVRPFFGASSIGTTSNGTAARLNFLIQPSGEGQIQWQNAAAVGGPYADISGATGIGYTIPANYDYARPFLIARYTINSTVIIARPGVVPLQATISQSGQTVRLQNNPLLSHINIEESILQYTYGTNLQNSGTACSATVGAGADGIGCRPLASLYSGASDPLAGLFVIPAGYFVRPQYRMGSVTLAITSLAPQGFMNSIKGGADASFPRRYVRMIVQYTVPGVPSTATITSNFLNLTLPLNDLAQLNLDGNILSVRIVPTLSVLLSTSHSTSTPAYSYERSKTGTGNSAFTGLQSTNSQSYTISSGAATDKHYRVKLSYTARGNDYVITLFREAVQYAAVSISINLQVAHATITSNSLVISATPAVTYQWQSSDALVGGTYTNILNATNASYNFASHDGSSPYLRVSVSYTHTSAGATSTVTPPILLASRLPQPEIEQNGRNVSLVSNGFPAGAIDKSSVLQYLRRETGILGNACSGSINSANCRPDIGQYASGSDATTGEFIFADSYFFRSTFAGSNIISNSSDSLGFWPGGGILAPERRVVRMLVEYKIAANGATYTLESNFVSLTLAADIAQVVGSGTGGRNLSISIPTSQASLFSNANNAAVFEWQSAPAADGTYTAIASANSSVYNAPSALTDNRFYRAVWQYEYKRGAQVVAITFTLSHAVAAPVVPVLALVLPSGLGDAVVNIASGGGVINTTPAAVYQWQNSDAADGTFADISGAVGTTYEITDSYDSTSPYLRVALTYTHNTENVRVTAYSPVELAVQLPQLSITIRSAQASVSVVVNANVISGSPAAVYQWQNSATENGTFADIPNVTGLTYDIPTTYDAARPYLRMLLRYTHTDTALGARDASSSAIRVAGVASGMVSFALVGEPVVGGVVNADISGLLNVLGRGVLAADLRFQWHSGDGSTWNAIATNGTGISYTIAADDFTNTNRQLSLQVEDRAALGGPYNPTAINLQRVPTGDVFVNAIGALSVGVTINTNTRGIADANGNGTNTYAWYIVRGTGARQLISGAENATLIIASTDLPSGSGALNVIVSITHTDALGFESVLPMVDFVLTDSASSGAPAIDSNSFYAGGQLTADVSGISDTNGTGTYTYQWQQQSAGSWANVSSGSGGNTGVYTLPASNWNGVPMLRVSVVHTDGLGYTANLISPPLALNQNPSGSPAVILVGGGSPVEGATARVVTSGISDANIGTGQSGTYTYQWQENDGTDKTSLATGQDYILTANDLVSIRAGKPPKVSVALTDSLGFEFDWTAEVRVVDVAITRTGAQLAAALTDHGNAVQANSARYQWLQSDAADGSSPEPISGETRATYTVPADYGVTFPFVLVSVTYMDTNTSAAANVVSSPLRVVGVKSGSGTVSFALVGEPVVGGVVNADITNLRSVLDRAVRADELDYEWYMGDGTNWSSIFQGTSYVIAAANFTNTRRQLSLRVTDPTGLSGPFNPSAIDLQRDTTGNVTLSASRLSVGATINTNTRGIADANGTGANTYAWYYMRAGGTPELVGGASDSALVIGSVPSGSGALNVIVSITHTDALGFETALQGVAFALIDSNSGGTLEIDSNSVRAGGQLTADVSGISDANGTGTYTYQWQQQSAGGSSWADVSSGSGGDTNTYTLPASGWGGVPMLRVSAVHTDGLGYTADLVSPPLALNQPSTGEPIIEVENNVVPINGTTLQVDVANIRDANNANTDGTGGAFVYEWQESTGTAKNNATDASYTLTAPDIAAIESGTPPQVKVTFTDNLGFANVWTVPFNAVNVSIRQTGANLQAALDDRNSEAQTSGRSYQWLQSATDGGTYTAISGATNNTYAVPVNYGTSHPFVRVSLSYFNTTYSRQTNAVSRPIVVAGVASGGVAGIVPPTNVGVGGVINADITNLRSVLGRAVRAEDLTYQWQEGRGNSFDAISGATSQNYILAAGVFNNSRNQLRLRVIDRADKSNTNTFDSVPLSINRLPTGELAVQGVQTRIGTTLTATRGQVNDANGVASIAYQWYRRLNNDTLQQISGATNSTLILVAADFVANVSVVAVGGSVTDALGFVNTVAAANARTAGDALERVSIAGTEYTPDAVFTAQTNLGDGVLGINYQWQRGQFDADGVVQYTSIDSANNATYNLVSLTLNAYPLLRVSVNATTQTGQTMLLSPSVSIAQPIIGALSVFSTISLNTATTINEQIIHVEFAHLRDANNSNGTVKPPAYEWLINNAARGTKQTLAINTTELISLASQFGISVRVVFEDDLGFMETLSFTLGALDAIVAPPVQLEDISGVLDAAALQSGGISQLSSGFANRLLAPSSANFQIRVNDREVGRREDLAAALAQRDSHSTNTDKNFALDSLAASGELGNVEGVGGIGGWVKGGLSQVEGNVNVDGQSRDYEGEVIAYFGGVDIAIANGLRWGLGVGYQESDIDAQLDDDGLMDDNLTREMTSFVSYSEWAGNGFNIHAMGGYGKGDLAVRKQQGVGAAASTCRGSAPSTWGFGGIRGEYFLTAIGAMNYSGYGNFSYSHSQVERGKCRNVRNSVSEIPAIASESGEAVLGLRLDFGGIGYVTGQARRLFGALNNDNSGFVYDGGGGISYTLDNLNVQIDHQSSFGNSNHKRRSYSGGLQYRSGGWNSQLSSAMANESGDWGINHRWQINHENKWWHSTFNSGIYVERRTAGGNAAHRAGGNLEISF